MTKVFISYRREDSKVIAGRIYDYLTPPLGPYEPQHVFKDVDSIPLGVNFKTHLERQVGQCAVALVVIGPNWLHVKNEDGSRRLDDENDFVRIEIESALKREIPVIPLLVMGAQMPKVRELPPSLAPLAFQNGTALRDDPDFRNDMARVRKSLEYWLNPAPPKVEVVQAPPVIVPAEPRYTPDQDRLLAIMLDPSRPPPERAEAGRKINKVGDPRPGVCNFDFKVGDYWCEVPAGEFTMGNSKDSDNPVRKVSIPKFYIAKYPVTYWQFQQFVDDPNGYKNAAWWQGLHKDGLKQQQGGVGTQKWQYDNHPRENVSWYEAMAFTRWLTARLVGTAFLPSGMVIRLPTEPEWEKAARGPDGREYPWGNVYQKGFANIDESNLGGVYLNQTTAVGIYPQSASPYQGLDMSGNVREWTLNEYSALTSNNLGNNSPRALRGGSWYYGSDSGRAAFRFFDSPNFRYDGIGFRVVCSAPVS